VNRREGRRHVWVWRNLRRDPSLTLDFVDRRNLLMPMTFAGGPGRVGGFGMHKGDGPQQELGEVAEGGGFLARNAALREKAKNLSESSIHAGSGGEVAAGGIKFRKIERRSDNLTSRRRVAEQLVFAFGVKAAQGGVNVGAGHGALASVGEGELAAIGQDFLMRQKRRYWNALLALDNRIIC
jgi:hypothetical protein